MKESKKMFKSRIFIFVITAFTGWPLGYNTCSSPIFLCRVFKPCLLANTFHNMLKRAYFSFAPLV